LVRWFRVRELLTALGLRTSGRSGPLFTGVLVGGLAGTVLGGVQPRWAVVPGVWPARQRASRLVVIRAIMTGVTWL
jgi:hypothetical protein